MTLPALQALFLEAGSGSVDRAVDTANNDSTADSTSHATARDDFMRSHNLVANKFTT